MRQAANSLRCQSNVEGDVSFSLVDRADVNHRAATWEEVESTGPSPWWKSISKSWRKRLR
jgi:hypothetical protein